MSNLEYHQYSKTIMDNIADSSITFNESGICNYYYEYFEKEKKHVKKEQMKLVFSKKDLLIK